MSFHLYNRGMTKVNKNIKIGATNKIFTMKNMNIELRDTLRKSGMDGRAAETLAIILTNFHNDMIEFKSSVDSGLKELKKDMDARFDKVDARFGKVDARFDKVNARFDKVDARFENVDARFENVETRLSFIEKLIVALLGITAVSALSNLAVLIKLAILG